MIGKDHDPLMLAEHECATAHGVARDVAVLGHRCAQRFDHPHNLRSHAVVEASHRPGPEAACA